MTKNLGKLDRTLRVILGLALIIYGVLNSSWIGAIGLIPLLTAIIAWCPLYCPLKIKTCSKENCQA